MELDPPLIIRRRLYHGKYQELADVYSSVNGHDVDTNPDKLDVRVLWTMPIIVRSHDQGPREDLDIEKPKFMEIKVA